jgi:HAMP domain-containing protein
MRPPRNIRLLAAILTPALMTSVALAQGTERTTGGATETTPSTTETPSPAEGTTSEAQQSCDSLRGRERALCSLAEKIKASGMQPPADCSDFSVKRLGLAQAFCSIWQNRQLKNDQGDAQARKLQNRTLRRAGAVKVRGRVRDKREEVKEMKMEVREQRQDMRTQRQEMRQGMRQERQEFRQNHPADGASNLQSMIQSLMQVREQRAAGRPSHTLPIRTGESAPGAARSTINRPTARTVDQGMRRWKENIRRSREKDSPIPIRPSIRDYLRGQ